MSYDAAARNLLLTPLPERAVWRAMLSGLCASFVGLGLARFAYTPLLSAIIERHWFSASAASYLGAANLAGNLAGALLATPMAARASAPALLRATMLLTTLALLACAWPVGFPWFFAWRFLSGLSGGCAEGHDGLRDLSSCGGLPADPQRRQACAAVDARQPALLLALLIDLASSARS